MKNLSQKQREQFRFKTKNEFLHSSSDFEYDEVTKRLIELEIENEDLKLAKA